MRASLLGFYIFVFCHDLFVVTDIRIKKKVCGCIHHPYIFVFLFIPVGTAVAQWLTCCATNRKVSGSIPAGVIGIFH